MNTYGTTGNIDYGSKIETIESAYSFMKFGKFAFDYCSDMEYLHFGLMYRACHIEEEKGLQGLECSGEHR